MFTRSCSEKHQAQLTVKVKASHFRRNKSPHLGQHDNGDMQKSLGWTLNYLSQSLRYDPVGSKFNCINNNDNNSNEYRRMLPVKDISSSSPSVINKDRGLGSETHTQKLVIDARPTDIGLMCSRGGVKLVCL